MKSIRDYLANGGRAVVALDANLQGGDPSPELLEVLKEWNLTTTHTIIVDPLSKMLGVDAAVPIIANFNKDHAISKDFQAQCYYPFARPVDTLPATPGMTAHWLAQSTPKSWAVADIKVAAVGGQPGACR